MSHIKVTLSEFVLHISPEKSTQVVVKKNAWSKDKIQDKYLSTSYFLIYIFKEF